MPSIEYRITDIEEIELVHPLWNQLNRHHHTRAGAFKSQYEQWTFDDRKAYFEKVAATGSLRIDLAFDSLKERYIGYCIGSLSPERTGEIESIFVEEAYRSQGIGSAFIDRVLAWFKENGSTRNRVSVGDGNEGAFLFYRKFGFSPRMTVLEQKKD
jgi:diamine N-acetyltransferase